MIRNDKFFVDKLNQVVLIKHDDIRGLGSTESRVNAWESLILELNKLVGRKHEQGPVPLGLVGVAQWGVTVQVREHQGVIVKAVNLSKGLTKQHLEERRHPGNQRRDTLRIKLGKDLILDNLVPQVEQGVTRGWVDPVVGITRAAAKGADRDGSGRRSKAERKQDKYKGSGNKEWNLLLK